MSLFALLFIPAMMADLIISAWVVGRNRRRRIEGWYRDD